MLVLSRRVEESGVVGAANELSRLLIVTVLGIHNGVVKLGFKAHDDIPIPRWEVWNRLTAQNLEADSPDEEISRDTLSETLPESHRVVVK